MGFEDTCYEMKKRGFTLCMMSLDLEFAKQQIGSWADKVSTNGVVLVPAWFLREEVDGSCIVILGSEPKPASEPVIIPKNVVKGIIKYPSEEIHK
jgi:hypothetical protein